MPSIFYHGPSILQSQDAAPTAITPASTPIGLIATAEDADVQFYPLNTPVLLSDRSSMDKAGTTGTLKQALAAIYDQGINPQIVVVRVSSSLDAAEQAAHVAAGTLAMTTSQSLFEVTPEILGAPGLDTESVAVTALQNQADRVGGFAYIGAQGATRAEVVAVRQLYNHRRMMLIWPEFERGETTVHAVAVALGLRSKIDANAAIGGRAKTLSNVPLADEFVSTVPPLTISRAVDYFGADSDGNYLNAMHVTTLRREAGLRFFGNRTCSNELMWQYESAVRMTDYLAKIIQRHEFAATDGLISQQLLDHRIEMIQVELDTLVRQGQLLKGARVIKHPTKNSVDEIREGATWLYADFTVPPPNEQPGIVLRITHDYLLNVLG